MQLRGGFTMSTGLGSSPVSLSHRKGTMSENLAILANAMVTYSVAPAANDCSMKASPPTGLAPNKIAAQRRTHDCDPSTGIEVHSLENARNTASALLAYVFGQRCAKPMASA